MVGGIGKRRPKGYKLFNYNVVNPVNIHYRKYPQNEDTQNRAVQSDEQHKPLVADENGKGERRFPNGNKVAIDYTKNQVNIAQILQDFRSTIAAINSPEDVKEEVESYLAFTSRESQKESPSREIILANLKNAARVTDKYIQDSLKKPSRVVQDWVDALFLQQINLKSDPNEINEDFRVKIPEKKSKEIISTPHQGGVAPLKEDTVDFSTPKEEAPTTEPPQEEPVYEVGPLYEPTYPETVSYEEYPATPAAEEEETQTQAPVLTAHEEESPYAAKTENEALAKEVLLQGRAVFNNSGDIYGALKLYDEALSLVEGSDNVNLKSAIYYERAKIFDSQDYAELALIDYNKATKAKDGNLRAHAHIKMGNIYDDYVQFEPAIDQYSRAIESSEEVNNLQGKTRALRYMATMFAGVYDSENTEAFSDLAMESARETNNPDTVAKTYLEAADNYKYIGRDSKALQVYSALAQEEIVQDDYETLAQNYMEAAMLMDKKGNKKKSYALMLKSKEYQRKARLQRAEG